MAEPTKAYYVERVSRCVVTVLVHASSTQDAIARARAGEGESIDAEYQLRGLGSVRRSPEDDERAPAPAPESGTEPAARPVEDTGASGSERSDPDFAGRRGPIL